MRLLAHKRSWQTRLKRRAWEADCWYRHGLAASTDPRDFRSNDLKPARLPCFREDIAHRVSIVEDLCHRRADLLAFSGQLPAASRQLPPGELLLYDPDSNLFCGAAESATDGFFDVDNIPPWDFWIDYVIERNVEGGFQSYLVSWIPAWLVLLVTLGVEANPEQCIAWAGDVRPISLRKVW